MSETQEKEKEEIVRKETRHFRYSNTVSFEFDVEVSDPQEAVAEITDFLDLMKRATADLEQLRKEQAAKFEKPKDAQKGNENGNGEAPPGAGSKTGK